MKENAFFSVADHLFTEKEALIISVINSLSITAGIIPARGDSETIIIADRRPIRNCII